MSQQALAFDPVIFPIIVCATTLVVALLLVSFATSVIALTVKRRRVEAMTQWKQNGFSFRLTPTQASFLNEAPSIGVGGNGTLALTEHALHFAQVMPKREIVIPFVDMAEVLTPTEFNGRRGGPFLVIRRRQQNDLTGFRLNGVQKWVTQIEAARNGAPMPPQKTPPQPGPKSALA
jgi:hypothetical protein